MAPSFIGGRTEPAERRDFWSVAPDGDRRVSLVMAGLPVERFGTASAVKADCRGREMVPTREPSQCGQVILQCSPVSRLVAGSVMEFTLTKRV